MNGKWLVPLVAGALVFGQPAVAHESDDQSIAQQLKEARLEGQLWTTYSLNRHLNPFDISVDVQGTTAALTGEVEDPVQKDLAAEIARGTDGIESVDNRIGVVTNLAADGNDASKNERSFGDRVDDLSTTATIKSKLVWNRDTSGFKVNVSTKNGHVILEGEAESKAGKELAGGLAANTDGVTKVDNRLVVKPETGENRDREVTGVVSDGWITTKVKSTLLFSSSVPGTDIDVDTREGVVSLKGKVATGAERDLAVKLIEDVRGVVRVDSSHLEVTG